MASKKAGSMNTACNITATRHGNVAAAEEWRLCLSLFFHDFSLLICYFFLVFHVIWGMEHYDKNEYKGCLRINIAITFGILLVISAGLPRSKSSNS